MVNKTNTENTKTNTVGTAGAVGALTVAPDAVTAGANVAKKTYYLDSEHKLCSGKSEDAAFVLVNKGQTLTPTMQAIIEAGSTKKEEVKEKEEGK